MCSEENSKRMQEGQRRTTKIFDFRWHAALAWFHGVHWCIICTSEPDLPWDQGFRLCNLPKLILGCDLPGVGAGSVTFWDLWVMSGIFPVHWSFPKGSNSRLLVLLSRIKLLLKQSRQFLKLFSLGLTSTFILISRITQSHRLLYPPPFLKTL